MWCLNSTSVSTLHLLDNLSMSNWSIKCIILQWLQCLFCGTVFSISSTRKTLTCKWLCPNQNCRVTSWGILCCTELELMEPASPLGYSWDGLLMPWYMQPLFSIAHSMFWRKKARTSLTAKILDSGYVACLFMAFAFLWQTQSSPSNITLTTGSARSSSSCVRPPTSCSSGSLTFHSTMKLVISSSLPSLCEFAMLLFSSLYYQCI